MFKFKSSRSKKNHAQRRSLTIETMEDRRLFAADWGYGNISSQMVDTQEQVVASVTPASINLSWDGNVVVQGTPNDDVITIEEYQPYIFAPIVKVTIADTDGDIVSTASFDKWHVKGIAVTAYEGNDYVRNDTNVTSNINGGAGADSLRGGSANDIIHGGSGDDYLLGNAGEDIIYGDLGNDYLSGGSGNDTIHGSDGDDRLYGSSGHDTVYGDAGHDFLSGYTGNDYLSGGTGNDTIHGSYGDDRLYGNSGHDTVYGDAGHDYLSGYTGNDYLSGGTGNDTIHGSYGDDRLYGNSGNDKLVGGYGADYLSGYSGNDVLHGDEERQSYTWHTYNVTPNVATDHRGGTDQLYGGSGEDLMHGGGGDDVLAGGSGDDLIYGNSGNDTLRGDSGDDELYGQLGDDNVYGGREDDWVSGGPGDDGLYGGEGEDLLQGGPGDDRFLVLNDLWHALLRTYTTEDTLLDKRSNDAKISFVRGSSTDNPIIGAGGDWAERALGHFTPAEIEQVDLALADLHHQVGNTKLLKQKNGGEITFERLGNTSTAINNEGKISFGDYVFNGTQDKLSRIIFEEIGHNWDLENDNWNAWKDISGWLFNPSDEELSTNSHESVSEFWYYDSSATFADDHGKTSPHADFATYFSKVMMDDNGLDYWGSLPHDPRFPGMSEAGYDAAKEQFMDDFFASLAND